MPSYENENILGAYWLITEWKPSTEDVCMDGDNIFTSFLVHVLSRMAATFLAEADPEKYSTKGVQTFSDKYSVCWSMREQF